MCADGWAHVTARCSSPSSPPGMPCSTAARPLRPAGSSRLPPARPDGTGRLLQRGLTVGGLGDLVEHQALGVETSLDASVSPTRLPSGSAACRA